MASYNVSLAEKHHTAAPLPSSLATPKTSPATATMRTSADDDYRDLLANAGLFGNLPAELRERVYELTLFTGQRIDLFVTERVKDPRNSEHRTLAHSAEQPPLTRTCRLLRDESLSKWYAEGRLVIGPSSMSHESVRNNISWIERIGAVNRRHIGNIIAFLPRDRHYSPEVEYGLREFWSYFELEAPEAISDRRKAWHVYEVDLARLSEADVARLVRAYGPEGTYGRVPPAHLRP